MFRAVGLCSYGVFAKCLRPPACSCRTATLDGSSCSRCTVLRGSSCYRAKKPHFPEKLLRSRARTAEAVRRPAGPLSAPDRRRLKWKCLSTSCSGAGSARRPSSANSSGAGHDVSALRTSRPGALQGSTSSVRASTSTTTGSPLSTSSRTWE